MPRALLAAVLLLSANLAAEQRAGYYRGALVRFEVVDGLAIYQGDIVLGRADEIEAAPAPAKAPGRESVVITGERYRWPGGKIAYTIEPADWSIQPRILQAIQHWNDNTPLKIAPRAAETSYIRFVRNTDQSAGICSSRVGMAGGRQDITLVDGCSVGSIIHEIGHAVGLWHEQSRADRNTFVTVLFDNIETKYAYNFDQQISTGDDIGPYDFGSIMHYSAFEFSKSGLPSIETVPAGIPLGQRAVLSAGDLDAVRRLYGAGVPGVTIGTNPAGLTYTVDGVGYNSAATFAWAEGTTHSIGVPATQGGAQSRYVFAAWSDAGATAHTVTASASLTVLTANFKRQYLVALNDATGGAIAIYPPADDGFYDDRSSVELTAKPDRGFQFLSWVNAQGASQGAANPRIIRIGASLAAYARFTQEPVTSITTSPPGRPVIVDGATLTAPQAFTWKPGTTHTVEARTTSTDPDTRYAFRNWSDGGAIAHSVLASATAATLTAQLLPSYRLSLTAASTTGGSLAASPSSPDGFYEHGSAVQLTALPGPGFTLSGWTGDLFGGNATRTISMTAPRDVTANFIRSNLLPPLAVLNAASFDVTPIVPGEIVTLFGAGIGPSTPAGMDVSAGKAATALANTRVLFDNVAAPLTYVSENQVSAVTPFGIAGRTSVTIAAERNGAVLYRLQRSVAESAPAIFTLDSSGRGAGAILNQDYSVNTPANPASRGEVVMLYATGIGATTPAGEDGRLAGAPLPLAQLSVAVRIDGRPARVLYAGAAPGLVAGVMQVNVELPDGIPPGPALSVHLVVGTEINQHGLTIAVH